MFSTWTSMVRECSERPPIVRGFLNLNSKSLIKKFHQKKIWNIYVIVGSQIAFETIFFIVTGLFFRQQRRGVERHTVPHLGNDLFLGPCANRFCLNYLIITIKEFAMEVFIEIACRILKSSILVFFWTVLNYFKIQMIFCSDFCWTSRSNVSTAVPGLWWGQGVAASWSDPVRTCATYI